MRTPHIMRWMELNNNNNAAREWAATAIADQIARNLNTQPGNAMFAEVDADDGLYANVNIYYYYYDCCMIIASVRNIRMKAITFIVHLLYTRLCPLQMRCASLCDIIIQSNEWPSGERRAHGYAISTARRVNERNENKQTEFDYSTLDITCPIQSQSITKMHTRTHIHGESEAKPKWHSNSFAASIDKVHKLARTQVFEEQ